VENLFRDYHDKVSSRIQNRKKTMEKQKQIKKVDETSELDPSPESTPVLSEADLG